MPFFISRRKLRQREPEGSGELNVVPYLDILMNLIVFMLLSMTGLATLGVVDASAAKYAPHRPFGEPPPPSLHLSVLVADRGFYIAASGGVLAALSGGGEAGPTLPRSGQGAYDFAGLTARLGEVKRAFPDESKIVIGADRGVPYQTLVRTLDACREDARGRLLFPDVSFAAEAAGP